MVHYKEKSRTRVKMNKQLAELVLADYKDEIDEPQKNAIKLFIELGAFDKARDEHPVVLHYKTMQLIKNAYVPAAIVETDRSVDVDIVKCAPIESTQDNTQTKPTTPKSQEAPKAKDRQGKKRFHEFEHKLKSTDFAKSNPAYATDLYAGVMPSLAIINHGQSLVKASRGYHCPTTIDEAIDAIEADPNGIKTIVILSTMLYGKNKAITRSIVFITAYLAIHIMKLSIGEVRMALENIANNKKLLALITADNTSQLFDEQAMLKSDRKACRIASLLRATYETARPDEDMCETFGVEKTDDTLTAIERIIAKYQTAKLPQNETTLAQVDGETHDETDTPRRHIELKSGQVLTNTITNELYRVTDIDNEDEKALIERLAAEDAPRDMDGVYGPEEIGMFLHLSHGIKIFHLTDTENDLIDAYVSVDRKGHPVLLSGSKIRSTAISRDLDKQYNSTLSRKKNAAIKVANDAGTNDILKQTIITHHNIELYDETAVRIFVTSKKRRSRCAFEQIWPLENDE